MSEYLKRLKEALKSKYDSSMQGNVNRAYELGETAGDVAAAGAAVGSTALDFVLPESEMDLLPVGKLTKMMKGVKAAKAAEEMPVEVRTKVIERMREMGMPGPKQEEYLKKLNTDELWRKFASEGKVAKTAEEVAQPVKFKEMIDKSKEVYGVVKGGYKPDAAQSEAAKTGSERAKQVVEAGQVRAKHVPKTKEEEDELLKRLQDY